MLTKLTEAFHDTYSVKPLIKEDILSILKLYQSNVDYYAAVQNNPVSEEDCIHDMTKCPPGISKEQKYYFGFYRDGTLAAVMDFVDGYPDTGTVYIGLFIVDRALHGKGVGSSILRSFLKVMKEYGYQKAALGCFESNTAGKDFWIRLGFTVDEIVDRTEAQTLRRLMKMSLPLSGK